MIYTYSTHNDTDILCIYIYMYDWTDRWMYAIQIDTVQPWYSAELWSLYIVVATVSCAWRLQLQGCPLRSSLEKLSPAAVAPGLSEFCIWRVWPRHEKTKTAFWSQKETWSQGSPRCTFSHRLWGGGHPSEWSRKRVSSMNPLGLQISEQFFDFKHFLSLSATFCFLEVKKYDTFGRTAIQLPEDTKEYEGYMACLKGSPTPPLRPRGHSDGRLWRVFGCCHGRISVGFSVGEHGRAMSVYSVHLSASQCSKDQKPMVFLVA